MLNDLFLTGSAVLVSTLGKDYIQLFKTPPGLHSALEAFEVVQVSTWTKDKER